MQKISGILGAVLVVSFFLPWVSMGPINASGQAVIGLASMVSGLAYAFYLIPLSGAALAYLEFSGNGTPEQQKQAEIAAGAVTILCFGYCLMEVGGDLFEGLGFGAYLTILAGIGSLLLGLGVIPKEPAADAGGEE